MTETFSRFGRFSRTPTTTIGRTTTRKETATQTTTETTETTKAMSYLEKAKRALGARAAAMEPPRCSRCLGLDAAGIAVLACACGLATHSSCVARTLEARAAYRQARRTRPRSAGRCDQLRLVEGLRHG